MGARLQEKYFEEVVPQVQKKFGVKNKMAVPRLDKVTINMGVGEAVGDSKVLEIVAKDLATITGQRPVVTKSRKAISNFKLRENLGIGCKVTLRRKKMFEFIDRLVNIALPRIKDFNGVSRKAFDGQGNYTLGLNDQSIFPEIDTGKMAYTQGMDITFTFNHGPQEQTFELLTLLGVPFRKTKESLK